MDGHPEPIEHPDTPMRKRPRLEGGAEDDCKTPSPNASNHHSDNTATDTVVDGSTTPATVNGIPSPLQTPSKVTLNLRSADSSPIIHQRPIESVSDDAMVNNNVSSSRASTEIPEFVIVGDSSPSDAGEVIDIEVDEPEDIIPSSQDGSTGHGVEENLLETCLELIEEFPPADPRDERTALDRACLWHESMGYDLVHLDQAMCVSDWIHEVWLAHAADLDGVTYLAYLQEKPFWDKLADVYRKLLSNRHLRQIRVPHYKVDPANLLSSFFLPFMQLCNAMVAADLRNFSTIHSSSTGCPEMISTKYLATLTLLTRNCGNNSNAPLWMFAARMYDMNVESAQNFLIGRFITTTPEFVKHISALCSVLLKTSELSSKFGNDIVYCVWTLSYILRSLQYLAESERRNSRANTNTTAKDHLNGAQQNAFEEIATFVRDTYVFLKSCTAKQLPQLQLDQYLKLVIQVADMSRCAMTMDSNKVEIYLGDDLTAASALPSQIQTPVVGQRLLYDLHWTLITKARMELRAQSVFKLSEALVDFHNYTQRWQEVERNALRGHVASWLIENKVVQYLASVESHPQLISRSHDIFGFLFCTGHWTDDLSDAVWASLLGNPDPRMCGAMWDALSKCMRYIEKDIILDALRRLSGLAPQNYQLETISFMNAATDRLYSLSVEGELLTENRVDNPLVPFQKIICDAADASGHCDDGTVIRNMLQQAQNCLSSVSQSVRSLTLRRGIYQTSLRGLEDQSRSSLGSIITILALLEEPPTEETVALTKEMKIFEIAVEELCSFVQSIKADGLNNHIPYGLEHRLHLCQRLAKMDQPSTQVPIEVQAKLLRHIVGSEAINNASRDKAWEHLKHLVDKAYRAPLVQYLITHFINTIAPEHFMPQLIRLVDVAIEKETPTSGQSPSDETEVINIPFVDCMWRLALQAPYGTIENDAVGNLSAMYIMSPYIKKATLQSVAATHTAVIDCCVGQLQDSATQLKQLYNTDQVTMKLDDLSTDASSPASSLKEQHALSFTRTLSFMKQLIDRTKRERRLTQPEKATSSPTVSTMAEAVGETVEIKWQAFGAGKSNIIRTLHIPVSATFGDLLAHLGTVTGFKKIQLIQEGTKLKLAGKLDKTIAPVVGKGLLLVQSEGHGTMVPSPVSKSTSAAERAVLQHLDQLFDLLDLEEQLGYSVYQFLICFTPHDQVRATIMSASDPYESFPDNRMKARYYVWSLRRLLEQHTKSNTMDEAFLVRTVRLMSRLLTTGAVSKMGQPDQDPGLTFGMIGCLCAYLKERPLTEKIGDYIENGSQLAQRLSEFLTHGLTGLSSCDIDYLTVYACLLEAALLDESRSIWYAFVNLPHIDNLHLTLLVESEPFQRREACSNLIINSYGESSPTSIPPLSVATFFWEALSALIPGAATRPTRCKELFDTLHSIFSTWATSLMDESRLRSTFVSWTSLLQRHEHTEGPRSPGRDEFVKGLVTLLSLCVTTLKSYKKPIGGQALSEILVDRLLFPPLAGLEVKRDEAPSSSPILDVESRKQASGLLASLIDNDESYRWLLQRLKSFISLEATLPRTIWTADRSRWLTSPVGFSGLTNLTNTCYMNSLMAQLFMNTDFRSFILASEADSSLAYPLLTETQNLFAHMQGSHERAAWTSAFTNAIRPYGETHIDVTVQMDVDEFYNLLFDRWETDLSSKEAKDKFRSFYGGQLVGQVKSKDCEHVSETVEPFFTIACEVRGKEGLAESLKAYVEGDVMEGDNKYKCESCDGRFVDAIKRQCLKDLPDNLIFNLKRFDFDLTTFQRSKINDKFTFPDTIDMTPYTMEYINNPSADAAQDLYMLVGVLVHMGTAETGHYYSYIRLPPTSRSKAATWAEFNDQDVSEFDYGKINDCCFGGETDTRYTKINNAYMLFYKRIAAVEAEDEASQARGQIGPADVQIPKEIADSIKSSNEGFLRRYGLVDPSYGPLVRRMLTDMTIRSSGRCSDSHETEKQVLEMTLDHATIIFSRVGSSVPDLEPTLKAVIKQVSNCAQCCENALDWIFKYSERTEEMLLSSSNFLVRTAWVDHVSELLRQHRKLDPESYGLIEPIIDAVPPSVHSSLYKVVIVMKDLLPGIGRYLRAWNEYFELWQAIAAMGPFELAVLLDEDIFMDVLEVLRVEKGHTPSKERYKQLHHDVLSQSNKRDPLGLGLVHLLLKFLENVDPTAKYHQNNRARLKAFDQQTKRYPLMYDEWCQVHYITNPGRQLRILTRVVDLWDDLSYTPTHPADIVTNLLECCKSAKPNDEYGDIGLQMEGSISTTLRTAVSDYELYWSKTPLAMALAFCIHTSDINQACDVIAGVARSANRSLCQLPPPEIDGFNMMMDYSNTGGQYVLMFYRELMTAHNICYAAAEGSDEPHFLAAVIDAAPIWASVLLALDCKQVRAETEKILGQLIFAHNPSDRIAGDASNSPASQQITEMDVRRCKANRALFNTCSKVNHHATRLQLPRSWLKHLGSVMAQSASFCQKLQQDDSGLLVDITRREDYEIVDHFTRTTGNVSDWRLDGDTTDERDGETETEWDPSDADDSDMLTEGA